MTPDRFETLAEAYGGDIARWPSQDRDDAALVLAADPDFAARVLNRARGLDEMLDAWTPLPVSADLREAVIAIAPRARPSVQAWLWRAGLGAGLAAACAAGLVVGVGLAPDATAADEVAAVLGSFDGVESVEDV